MIISEKKNSKNILKFFGK